MEDDLCGAPCLPCLLSQPPVAVAVAFPFMPLCVVYLFRYCLMPTVIVFVYTSAFVRLIKSNVTHQPNIERATQSEPVQYTI